MKLRKVLVATLAAVLVVAAPLTVMAETASSVTVTGFLTENAGTEEISGEFDVTYKFHNQTNGTSNWNNFIVEVKTADLASGFTFRADRCGWGFGEWADDLGGDWGPSIIWTDTAGYNWDTFVAEMADADCEVNVKRTGNVITFTYKITTAAGGNYEISGATPEIPDLADDFIILLSGEAVTLTNITYTDNNATVEPAPTPGDDITPTGDFSMVLPLVLVLMGGAVVIVASKKRFA